MKYKCKRLISALLTAVTVFGLFMALPIASGGAAAASSFINVGPRGNTGNDPAGGIYVSPTGNDSAATGSIDKPYKSINAALAAAKSGDTIILRGGTYREGVNVRVRKPNITIKSAKGEWAVIDLSNYNSGHNEDSGVYFDVDSSGGKLQCVEVIGGYYAVCMETKWNWGGDDDYIAASNIVIEDCVLHDSRYDVVKVKPNCDNITIRYCEIYNSGRAFDGQPHNGEQNAEGIDNVNGDNMTVQNCYIHHIISNAIYAKGGATDVLIENNRIETAYGAGIMVGFDTSPDFFDLSVNPQYYENIRGVVRNNLIIGAGWEGIGLYGSKDAQIYNNTLVNVCNGGQYHSAIYFGLTYQDWDSKAKRPANINPSIHHNIVCQPNGFVRPMIEIRYANELGGMSALDGDPVMNDNCYFITGKKASFTDRRPKKELENAGLSAWQAHIGGESGTLEADPVLDSDYMATNTMCAGMGIQVPLTVTEVNQPATAIYTLTVSGGTGGGSYAAGQTVNIAANAAPVGKVFEKWTASNGGSFGNANSASTTFTMPSGAVTVTAVYKDQPATTAPPDTSKPDNTANPQEITFVVTVNGGTGGGSYAAGETVNITVTEAPPDKIFDGWTAAGVTLSNPGSVNISFVMPANAVTVTAAWKDAPAETYTVTVTGGTGGTARADVPYAAAGETVTLTAEADEGYSFQSWQVADGDVTISDGKFIMPEGNVTINAVFELTSDSTIPGVSEPVETPDTPGNGTTTETGETTERDGVSAENGGNGWLWFLLGGLVIVVAGGGFAFILIKKKTKLR